MFAKYKGPVQIGEWELSECHEQLRLENKRTVITANPNRTISFEIEDSECQFARETIPIEALKEFIARYEELYGAI